MKIRKHPEKRTKNSKKSNEKTGRGIIDHIVDKLPEIHIPGYQYCGPGTDLNKRLQRGDPGINELDRSCKAHDIQYSKLKDSKSRRKADKVLFKQSLRRIISSDAKLSERAAAALVSSLIGAKIGLTKVGLGIKKRKRSKKMSSTADTITTTTAADKKVKKDGSKKKKNMPVTKRKKKTSTKTIPFSVLVRNARASIKSKSPPRASKDDDTTAANFGDSVKAAIRSVKQLKRNKSVKVVRVLKLPKFGGNITPILSILSALSAIGSIPSTVAAVAKAYKGAKQFVTQKKTNGQTEKKIGRGLYLSRKVKGGSGFYLKPIKFH